MNPTFKRYLISSSTTFLAAFFLAAGAQLQSGVLANGDFQASVLFAVISVALRAAVKAVIEGYAGSADPIQ